MAGVCHHNGVIQGLPNGSHIVRGAVSHPSMKGEGTLTNTAEMLGCGRGPD